MRRIAAIFFVCLVSPLVLHAQTLSNGIITARFGTAGLRSIEASGIERHFDFDRDSFSVSIDGKRYDSEGLGTPQRLTEQNRVGYVWITGPYRIVSVYELMPGWAFLSKHVSVATTSVPEYRVDEIALFRASFRQPISQSYIHRSTRQDLGLGAYAAALRFQDGRSLLAAAQSPFLAIDADANGFNLAYRPELAWDSKRGAFVSDRGILVPAVVRGEPEPARMLPEWQLGPADPEPGFYRTEIEALSNTVRHLMLYRPTEPVNIFVGWCVNDYQIDIASEEGRAEYKRVIDRAAELGARHVLFAPTNSDLAKREDSTDDWSWENLLWLGLGQKIRKNEWNPANDAVPASVQEMLDYARSKKVSLVAYVYPVLAFTQNAAWLTTWRNARPDAKKYASLASPALQDWLIETLVAFRKRTGISGYAFDHTFLNFAGASAYAQWWGWRRVTETLRQRMPDIVIDGRQAYHLYGPWGWLAGSYPHPTYNDEQPESFRPFPDLSFDRVSANRERYTAYYYRNHEFAPGELVPGFITHQTSRSDDTGEMPQKQTERGVMLTPFRVRDWDYLGWRYSLLSSIAVGAWNNVINYIPARDPQEFRYFSEEDKRFFRRWLEFARLNRELFRKTRTILGQPAIEKVDGTAAIENNHGYIFLFNPNARRIDARVRLDDSIGLLGEGPFHIEEIYPRRGRRIGKPILGFWSRGDTLGLDLAGHSATVLEIQPAPTELTGPMIFNVPGRVTMAGDTMVVRGVTGEAGTTDSMLIVKPKNQRLTKLRVNGREVPIPPDESGAGFLSGKVDLAFAGARFHAAQQVGEFNPAFTGGTFSARFTVPRRVFDQLAARRRAWPIEWTAEDLKTPWLAPERLLLYVQIAEPGDKWNATLTIDGRPVELPKAYSAVRAVDRTFVGFYADMSWLAPDQEHELKLVLPPLKPGQFQGVFFENVETEYTERLR